MAPVAKKRYLVMDDNSEDHTVVMAVSPEDAMKQAQAEHLWYVENLDEGDGATVWQSPVEFYVAENPRTVAWKKSS